MHLPKIRTITLATGDRSLEGLVRASRILSVVRARLEEGGFVVQTQRVAWPEFGVADVERKTFHIEADEACGRLGIDFLSIGCTRQFEASPKAAEMIAPLSRLSFCTLFMVAQELHSKLLRGAIKAIRILSENSVDGIGNFKFCASFATPPHIPFFPAAYSSNNTAFCIGLENGLWLRQNFEQDPRNKIEEFQDFGRDVRSVYQAIEKTCKLVEEDTGIPFVGIDPSINPSVAVEGSMVGVLSALGREIGRPGMTAICERLTARLRELPIKQVGFRGLMFPVLEDIGLSKLATDSGIRINDLLLYSCMCGVGLDMLPLAGNISDNQLGGLLADVGALSFRLRKPLIARLLPIPGKKEGETTSFKAHYLCNCAIINA